MTDLEKRIAGIMRTPCGCNRRFPWDDASIRGCSDCLPKRIAAAIEAATYSIMSTKDDITNVALRALKGEP